MDFDEVHCKSLWENQLSDLVGVVASHGIGLDARSGERLLQYCLDVGRASQVQGLVSRSDLEHLVSKHVAASLGVLSLLQPGPGEAWLDAGTGAGLPGLVIQVCRPPASLTLLDSSQRKITFLEEERSRLDLPDLELVCARLEDFAESGGQGPLRKYDVILTRAMAPLGDCLRWSVGVSRSGSRLVVFKGPRWEEELAQSRTAISRSGWTFKECRQIPWAPPKLLLFTMA